ncbi:MAG: hypothetical protein ACR2IN_04250 [Thermoleophilaceae bacterium]
MKKMLTAFAGAAALAAIAPQAALAQGELPVADVGIEVFDAPDPVTVGDELTYTVNVFNRGPFDAPDTIAQDRLDPSVQFVSATPSQGSCQLAARLLTCNLGLLTNGERARVIVVVRPTVVGQVTNRASVSADVIDLAQANNEDFDSTKVVPQCDGLDATIAGTGGPDKITGTPNRDVIVALGGNDVVNGGGGDDVICGGANNDTLRGKGSNDRLLGQVGRDTLVGGATHDSLDGGADADRIFADEGNDRLVGGLEADRLAGEAGADDLFGGAGRDDLGGGAGADRLDGGAERDRCSSGPGRDTERNCER